MLFVHDACTTQVVCNQRGRNASQLNLTGSGIGSFNDRFRDALMGGSPFAPSRCARHPPMPLS